MSRSVHAWCEVFQSICSVFGNFTSLVFFLSWLSVLCFVLCAFRLPAHLVFAAVRSVTQLLPHLYRSFTHKRQICWWEMDRKWERLEALLEAVTPLTSTPAPLAPYQPARPTLLIEPAASQSPAEIDCAAVSITSDSHTPLLPPPRCPAPSLRPLLVIYLLWAFLIWARVAHHCSQRVCLRERKLLFTRWGFMDFCHGACVSKQQVEDKNCFVPPLPPWISCPNEPCLAQENVPERGKISRTFSPPLLFLYMIIRSSRGRLVALSCHGFRISST